MEKLHVWKLELTKTLEITETEIDSLEHELKSLVSDAGSFPTEYQNKTCGGPLPVEKIDSSPEEVNGAEDSDDKSSDTTSNNAPDSIEPEDDRAIKGSSLFGMFALRERPKWMKISSLDELKTKVGHVIVMILLVKMFEKSKMVTISTGLDLLSYSVCIFLSSASFLYIYDSNCFASKLSFTL
uniref:Uncharacterized protein n=1 Tax=Lactuca sativa TaxID=4236 RepID=A0A9R1WFW6_LACSA|nr:hypothetical protein LSAT_V11C200068840 [Lactuca sativa]